jgi:hypothetical protein
MSKMKLWVVKKFDKSIKYGLNKSREDGYNDGIKEAERNYNNEIENMQYNHHTELISKEAEIKRLSNKIEENKKIVEKSIKEKFFFSRKIKEYEYILNGLYQKLLEFSEEKERKIANIKYDMDNILYLTKKDQKIVNK